MHNLYSHRVKNALSKTHAEKLAREYGTFYSVFIELQIFYAITFCVIDPMHNCVLGTAKKIFKLWVENDVLSSSKLERIQEWLESINSGSMTDIGRIPSHISGNYGVFSAAEWKKLDYYIFIVLFMRNFTRKSLQMLGKVCFGMSYFMQTVFIY